MITLVRTEELDALDLLLLQLRDPLAYEAYKAEHEAIAEANMWIEALHEVLPSLCSCTVCGHTRAE